ncbi:hypothetical protein ACFX13_025222 [Malus domestica]
MPALGESHNLSTIIHQHGGAVLKMAVKFLRLKNHQLTKCTFQPINTSSGIIDLHDMTLAPTHLCTSNQDTSPLKGFVIFVPTYLPMQSMQNVTAASASEHFSGRFAVHADPSKTLRGLSSFFFLPFNFFIRVSTSSSSILSDRVVFWGH